MFMAVNILVVATISIVLNVLGVQPYLTERGIDYQALMTFCLIWGFGGALISLGLSRIMAKMLMGVQVIDSSITDPDLRWLVSTVERLATNAGLPKMPEVGIYESPDANAFATGPTKSRALVAVSSGLMNGMNRQQIEGVLGHEIAHVANGDMVTMTLIQGVVNAFVMFFARVIGYAISMNVREENRRMVQMFVVIALDILLSFLGMIVVAYFSRLREYRADAGGAKLAGRDKMVEALKGLQRYYGVAEEAQTQEAASVASLKISGRTNGFLALLSTHPPLEDRIQRLQSPAIQSY